jgi:TolB-like protein/tetratricopeptide (TPR) repeat protein
MSATNLIAELKRRRVFRVAGVYLVASWGVIEGASALLSMLELPMWIGKAVVAVAVLGFPLALALAWAFDITEKGLERAAPAEGTSDHHRILRTRTVAFAGVLIVAAVVAGIGTYAIRAHSLAKADPAARTHASLAVLPFVNLSRDSENEYFADGMTEELIAALSTVTGLRVVSRTSAYSFKGKNADVRAVGEALGVATVLEGSVRKAGDQLRITVKLVDASNGYHLWSAQYDRKFADIFAIQEEISHAVVGALATHLGSAGVVSSGGRLARRGTDDHVAYELYLQGRHLTNKWSNESVRRGIAYFDRAIERDSTFARAYAGLADAFMWLIWDGSIDEALPRAREAARRALLLDDSLSEAHYAAARIASEIDWDWPTAEFEFRRALELDPSNGEARHRYAHLLTVLGRYDEATAESHRLIELDHLNAEWHHHLGWNYLFARQYGLAEAPYRKALELDPNVISGWAYIGILFVKQGRFADAIEMFQEDLERHGPNGETLSNLAWGYAMVGDSARARAILAQMDERGIRPPAWRMAYVHAGLADKDNAFEWLERAFTERRALFQFVKDPRFDPIRQDPRFREFLRRMKLTVEA